LPITLPFFLFQSAVLLGWWEFHSPTESSTTGCPPPPHHPDGRVSDFTVEILRFFFFFFCTPVMAALSVLQAGDPPFCCLRAPFHGLKETLGPALSQVLHAIAAQLDFAVPVSRFCPSRMGLARVPLSSSFFLFGKTRSMVERRFLPQSVFAQHTG